MVRANDQAVLAATKRRSITNTLRELPQMIWCTIVGYTIHYPQECLICEAKCDQYYHLTEYLKKYGGLT